MLRKTLGVALEPTPGNTEAMRKLVGIMLAKEPASSRNDIAQLYTLATAERIPQQASMCELVAG